MQSDKRQDNNVGEIEFSAQQKRLSTQGDSPPRTVNGGRGWRLAGM